MNTIQMLTKLFPKTKNIPEVAEILEKHKNFGINTNLRLAHFLAQVREEVGPEFKPVGENMNYSADRIEEIFKKRFDMNGNKKLEEFEVQLIKSVIGYPEQISAIAYVNRMGNGEAGTFDGWNYRGAGTLQITGKDNYKEVQRRIDKYAPTSNIDIIMYPKDIHTLEGSVLAGLGFWLWKDLYKIADKGISEVDVDNITRVINLHTESYLNRRQHFLKIRDLIN